MDGCQDGTPFFGSVFQYLAANVVLEGTDNTLLPPYKIFNTSTGEKIAFIGETFENTPLVVTPTGVAGLDFLDEADTVNALIPELKQRGVETIVLLLHQGGFQTAPFSRGFVYVNACQNFNGRCQMNAHDSERIKGMLESLGLGEAPSQDGADVLVFNTCTIREKPDTKLAAYLGEAGARKRQNPELVVAVGGCYAEAQRERIFELYPQVDVAFGPGSILHLGEWIGAGGHAPRGHFGTHEHFAGDLPMHRERAFSAWVQVSMGCNSKCAYCIVPAVRGREQSRRPGEIVAEVTRLAADGVREITLLGQNVNSWGRDLRPALDTEFGELLRACDGVEGIERIRFTSPHPKDFREPVIAAIAECDAVCEHIHLPLQSGSPRILKAMRRTYDADRYLRLVARLREAIPDLALGTDLIVGFPGETDLDFEQTLELVETVGFDSAFTFIYSPRQGTEAATMPDQVPDELKHERLERLVDLVQRIAAERNAERVGRVEEVLVEGSSRTDASVLRGRTRRNTTVNFAGAATPGELVDVLIEGSSSTTLRGIERAAVAA